VLAIFKGHGRDQQDADEDVGAEELADEGDRHPLCRQQHQQGGGEGAGQPGVGGDAVADPGGGAGPGAEHAYFGL
jgi:hypothetical protein